MAELITLGVLEPGTPEWLAARRDRLGGSEVAAALGLSPWCSPFTLWHRKRGLIGPGEETPSMYWGKKAEPIILAEYRERHDIEWVNYPCTSYANAWRIAAPDARTVSLDTHSPGELVEIKTADKDDAFEWGDDGSDDPAAIPPYYRVQCLWYMDLLGEHRLNLAVLIGGNDYREYTVPWDQAEADDIRARARVFHQTVVANVRPDIDSSASTYETVRELHPDIDGETVEVPADIGHNYMAWDRELKQTKESARLAKTRLLDVMGTARLAAVGGELIARRQSGRNGSISLYPLHPKEES